MGGIAMKVLIHVPRVEETHPHICVTMKTSKAIIGSVDVAIADVTGSQ